MKGHLKECDESVGETCMAAELGDDSAYPARWDDWTLGKWVWSSSEETPPINLTMHFGVSLPVSTQAEGNTKVVPWARIADDEDMKLHYEPRRCPARHHRATGLEIRATLQQRWHWKSV